MRIEDSFAATLRFGLEYYGSDDFNKLGEDFVTADTSATGDGLSFSMQGTPVAGTVFVRPIVLFDDVNPAYLEQNQANVFIFETSLSEAVLTGLPGDYNDDGVVDAADYTVWRDNLGGDAAALSCNGSGESTVVQAAYDLWRGNHGASSIIGVAAVAAPEPAGVLFAVLACVLAIGARVGSTARC